MRRVIATLLLTAALCGCVAPRIRSELLQAGVAPSEADCLSRDLSKNLTIAQLQRLGHAVSETKKARGVEVRAFHTANVIEVAQRDGDPATIAEVARAGAHCAVLPSIIAPGR